MGESKFVCIKSDLLFKDYAGVYGSPKTQLA